MLEFLSFAISPLEFVAILMLIAVGAGVTGALLGLGGGVFLVPAMVVLFGIDIQTAIVASLVSVIGTSSGSASTFLKNGLCDLRIAMFLEVATVVGGIAGAIVAVTLLAGRSQVLVLVFVPIIVLAAVLMYRSRSVDVSPAPPPDAWADRLKLHARYFDTARGTWVDYRVTGTKPGLLVAGFAGIVSGLLGIGGGLFVVPALNSFMNVPVRVASATSNFMIGVTATAGALVYFLLGHLSVGLAAPVAIGVLSGSFAGARLQETAPAKTLKGLFVAILVLSAVVMLLRGTGVL